MGKLALRAWAYLTFYALSYASGAIGASMLHSSVVQAEESAKDLVKVLSEVKSNIRPRHCSDLLDRGQTVSGIYTIFLPGEDVIEKNVYCDMDTDGGGWTVIQKRGQFGNSVFYFYRNWTEYATGFGDPAKEYWIGWDALTYSNGFLFSTYDQDNDKDVTNRNCAKTFRGAWWYRSCHMANLNGLNLNGQHESYADGIEWSAQGIQTNVYRYSYPSVYMMIRPAVLHTAGHNRTLSET